MRRQTLVLLALFLAISGWILWARLPLTQRVTLASEPSTSPIEPQTTPVQVEADWPTYTHPTWGISFRYHPDWTASIPDFETLGQIPEGEAELGIYDSSVTPEQIEFARTLGHAISLYPKEGKGWGDAKIEVLLSNYTLSPGGSLETWATLFNEGGENRSPYTLDLLPIETRYVPAAIEQALHAVRKTKSQQLDTLWLARDELVYGIAVYGSESRVIDLAYQITASLEFDPQKEKSLRETARFAGDEEALRQFNESMRPLNEQAHSTSFLPTVTPTPNKAALNSPRPTPSPTPRIRATVTPSAFESPLVNGLKQHRGHSLYEELPPFEIGYDPDLWQLAEGEHGRKYLIHKTIEGCELDLLGAAMGAEQLSSVTLAEYEWDIFYTGIDSLTYSMSWDRGGYLFRVYLPTPVPTEYDPNNKSQCEQDAETVLDTFTIVEVP